MFELATSKNWQVIESEINLHDLILAGIESHEHTPSRRFQNSQKTVSIANGHVSGVLWNFYTSGFLAFSMHFDDFVRRCVVYSNSFVTPVGSDKKGIIRGPVHLLNRELLG